MSKVRQNPRLAQTRASLERYRDELALVFAVAETANESENLRAALSEATDMICEHLHWELGRVLANTTGQLAPMGDAFEADPESEPEFDEPSLLAARGRLVSERRPVVMKRDQVSYFSLPIVAGEEVVAGLEFLSASTGQAKSEHLEQLLTNIATILSRVAERERQEHQRNQLLRAEIAREAAETRAAELERLTQELRRRNRELDQFAYVASHDLRAPLRGIANLSSWLSNDLEPHLTEETRRYLEMMQGRVERMEGLINGLLEYSRVGRKATPDEQVELGALTREIAELVDTEKKVEWVFGELPTLTGPSLLLRQVYANFMSNAVKYAINDAPRVELSAERLPKAWRLLVRDNGPGIDPRYHNRIWEIFQVLQPRDQVESTGIGLSLVRKIVEQRGGEVGLESTPGEGATFYFTWPDPT
ncbi:hypothetical protein G6O69_04415 [Pseudenhygromyxa sp. WMMC2535]|uniref:sensor histidine kinase n=1 Tax=Pseudenhygromyxa sp. WMMC2535 TaxID=2712867 RepID=UPI0015533D0F|nr:ATP-binding protein [Pseudenhygromyxa sp. WMMC2535]NVB37062.1 hypothetical protein [Pseudenhygromyxa sp. WMMC2535]